MAGGSQIIINQDGIKIITPAKFEAKAGQHKFLSGDKIDHKEINLPDMENPYILQYLVKNKENQIMAHKPYILIDEDGNIQRGSTDQNGLMKLLTAPSAQKITTRVMINEIEQAGEKEIGEKA